MNENVDIVIDYVHTSNESKFEDSQLKEFIVGLK